ncbi:hypothetical protein TWF694_003372 [Orbilia ellipsospora]|uniref:Uncharacterized protein n=1 Tax=Orbilia ellipsospora TaxID=2528407 RepID=A0AAV9WXX0_9PEZI
MMWLSTLSLFAVYAGFANAAILQARDCAANNCLRAVRNTNTPRGLPDCSSFFATTVTPATITFTATNTQTLTSTILATATLTTPTLTTITLSVVSTVLSSFSVTTFAKRQITNYPSVIPTYASACSSVAAYSSACSCLSGFKFPFPVTVTAPSTTVTISPTLATSYTTTTVATVTTASITTTTSLVPTATVTRVPVYIQATDSSYAGNYVYNDGGYISLGPSPVLWYWDPLTGHMQTPGSSQIWTAFNDDSFLSSFVYSRSLPAGTMAALTCSFIGTSATCGTSMFPATGLTSNALIIGPNGLNWAAYGYEQVHLRAVIPPV